MAKSIQEAEVRFPGHGGGEIGGRWARPAGGDPVPAVVVVHEIFGLDDHFRDLCRRFAAEGFAALAPDLWRGDPAFPGGDAGLDALRAYAGTVPDARLVGDLAAAARWLAARPDVRGGAVGTVGFCMGGTLAFHLACEPDAPVKACVDFYGRLRVEPPTPEKPRGCLDRVGELRAPLLGIFGAVDDFIPLRDVLALKESLGARGHVIAYPRAGHGFLNDTRPNHREDDAGDAWRRTLLFLRERLAPDTLPPDAAPAVPEFRAGPGGGRKPRGPRGRKGA